MRAPEYHGEPGRSSLKHDTDMVPVKTTTDVIVAGHAHAPDSRPTTYSDAGLRVGNLVKTLRITGDRQWGPAGASSPQPFTTMPLLYERAFGGVDLRSDKPERDWDWRNPVGRGFFVSDRHARDQYLPNIEYADQLVTSWNDRPTPAGFGPIACHWQPRVSLAGTYDDDWERTRKPLVPDDLRDEFYQCAATDQRAPAFLRGGEPVWLRNLAASGDLQFALPRIHLGFETRFYGGGSVLHPQRLLHTVVFEPDDLRVSLVWQSALRCHSKMYKLKDTLVTVKTDLHRALRPFVKQSLEVI